MYPKKWFLGEWALGFPDVHYNVKTEDKYQQTRMLFRIVNHTGKRFIVVKENVVKRGRFENPEWSKVMACGPAKPVVGFVFNFKIFNLSIVLLNGLYVYSL